MANHIAYISVGSNIGNKLENCHKGVDALISCGSTDILKHSRTYKTDPVDYTDQDWFINYVIKIRTVLDPLQLLTTLIEVQHRAGRMVDKIRFGPRVLDMDILLFDDLVLRSARLIIPHPRMHKRRFVLQPICDIDPKIIHPILKKSMQYLLDSLKDSGQGVEPYP